MMKYFVYNICIFSLLIFTLYGCNQIKKQEGISETLIKKIVNENINYPSSFSSYLFFGTCTDAGIFQLSVYDLREIHSKDFNNLKFDVFLTQFLNQKISVNCNGRFEKIIINPEVAGIYEKNGVSKLLNKYCERKGSQRLLFKKEINDRMKYSVLYFLFLNNYISNFDDYSGEYIISKFQ